MLPELAPLRTADAIVVLGNRPAADARGEVRPETRRRVEAGVRIFREGRAPILVLSGGKTGAFVEAEVMRALALRLGVPEAVVLMERRSTSTITNARFSVALLRRRLGRKDVSVIVVSSPYHLARAQRLFQCAGASVQPFAAQIPDSALYRLGFTLYESWLRVTYLFFDACAAARGARDRPSYRDLP